MFKNIPGNNKYIISLSQEIRGIDGGECALTINGNNVLIEMYNVERLVDIKWLSLVAHFEIYLPIYHVEKLFNISFENINPNLTKSVSGKTIVFKNPLYIVPKNRYVDGVINNKKIYRIIPNFTKYAISKDGEIIEIESEKILNISTNRIVHKVVDLYPSVYVYNPEKCYYRYVYLHRLVALAWVHNNDRIVNVVVNHKDGNKQNYHSYNLEWCTYSYNNLHAVNNGLRGDNISCKIRNFYTKEVIKFNSIAQANNYMGLKERSLRVNTVYDRKAKLINGKYEFKLDTDNTPWFYEDKDKKVSPGRYIVTITYPDKSIEYFSDARDIRNKFQIHNIRNLKETVIKIKKLHPDYKIEIIDNYNASPIQAYNINSKEIIETNTLVEMSKKLDMPEHLIRSCLRASETHVKNNYAFRYKVNDPWSTDFVKYEKVQTRILATNILSNEIINFDSIRKTAKHFKCDRSSIKNCLINNLVLNNWSLKEIKE